MIKFYYSPQSSATRVHIALEELGEPYEKMRIHLDKGDQKKPEFLAINPNGKVPALVDGDVKMFESLAICCYLGDKYGAAKGLWPKAGTPEHAEALTWMFWLVNEPQPALMDVVMHGADVHWAYPKEHKSAFLVGEGKTHWDETMAILDKRLEGREWLLGKTFSLADVAVGSGVAMGPMFAGLPLPKNVGAWCGRLQARPAFGRAMNEK
jgi:glutathione S-transferase